MEKYAYVTLATTESFLQGAKLLAYSLERVHSQYPLIILITENLAHLVDDEHMYRVIPYEQFTPPKEITHRYVDTRNKLRAFDLVQYKRVLVIDADIFILENIDWVFEKYPEEEFLCGIRNDGVKMFCGDRLMITPKAGQYDEFWKDPWNENYPTDEQMLEHVYQDFFNKYDTFYFPGSAEIEHLSGYKKYWEYLNVYPELLDEMSTAEIIELFQGWFAVQPYIKK